MRNEKTKTIVNYDTSHDTVGDLQDGDYFVQTDEYNNPCLFLYVNENCIIELETGIAIEPTYFEDDDEIEIVKKVNITVEK